MMNMLKAKKTRTEAILTNKVPINYQPEIHASAVFETKLNQSLSYSNSRIRDKIQNLYIRQKKIPLRYKAAKIRISFDFPEALQARGE